MNQSVENYFINGCGRCSLGGTPQCKVHQWTEELKLLRTITNSFELKEESKWGVPCYTLNNKNVLMICAFKEYCAISFFKGSLIRGKKGELVKAGPNSYITRLLKFKSLKEIEDIDDSIRNYIAQAVSIEEKGLKVKPQKEVESIPEELAEMFSEDPGFKSAFEALSSGRQRGYILHFSQAKQAKTRLSRIEKCLPMIMAGIGMHDHYKQNKK